MTSSLSKNQFELRPVAGTILQRKVKPMRQQDFLHHGQANALALVTGGVEWREELGLRVG